MTSARPPVDWRLAYARLEQAARALEAGASRSPEEMKRILMDRARALAKPLEEAPAPALWELLVFSLANERCGVDTTHVRGVVPLRHLTPVPCTPTVVLGVLNYRGRVLPVLDLRALLELPRPSPTAEARSVVVEAGGMTFAILAEAVPGIVRVGTPDVTPARATFAGAGQHLIRAVTREMVLVLDLEALARDPRIMVNDGAG